MLKEKNYSLIYDCIVSEQIPANRIAEYFKDKKFYNYYKKKRCLKKQ